MMVVSRRRKRGREEVQKPTMIHEYNNKMGGVDKADQLLSYYSFDHRTIKWWKRAAFHLIEVTVINAFILYSNSHQDYTQVVPYNAI